jgi:hypothetical protein
MNKKILLIDVGTHYGQEYNAIFSNHFYFLHISFKQFILRYFFKIGDSVPVVDFLSIIKLRRYLKSMRSCFKIVFIEPNPFVVRKFYRSVDLYIPCALENSNSIRLANLYISKGNLEGQGNSIYRNNLNYGHILVAASSAKIIALKIKEDLKIDLNDNNLSIILRINCEGAEDEVIYDFQEIFKSQLKAVLGALKDVSEIKGDAALIKLHSFMDSKKIIYIPFTPSISTWLKPMTYIKKLIFF